MQLLSEMEGLDRLRSRAVSKFQDHRMWRGLSPPSCWTCSAHEEKSHPLARMAV